MENPTTLIDIKRYEQLWLEGGLPIDQMYTLMGSPSPSGKSTLNVEVALQHLRSRAREVNSGERRVFRLTVEGVDGATACDQLLSNLRPRLKNTDEPQPRATTRVIDCRRTE